jgi:tetratricopeptide (TPR) repeat protein
MIRRILFVALAAVLSACHAIAANPNGDLEALADAAGAAFRQGIAHRGDGRQARADFRRAAEYYGRLSANFEQAPEVYLARGSAWLLAGDVARAIIAFHDGLRRFSAHQDLRRALDYARSQVAYDRAEDRAALAPRLDRSAAWKRWLAGWGAYAVALASILGWFLVSRWVATRRTSLLAGAGLVLASAVAIAAACFIEQRQHRRQMDEHFVVVAQPTTLFSGDGTAYPARRESALPAGVEVIVRHRRDSWVQVELADGSLGWLPEGTVIRLPANREQLSR